MRCSVKVSGIKFDLIRQIDGFSGLGGLLQAIDSPCYRVGGPAVALRLHLVLMFVAKVISASDARIRGTRLWILGGVLRESANRSVSGNVFE